MSGVFSDQLDTTGIALNGLTDGGQRIPVPVTPEGHLEVAVHGPRLPFGSIHTESLTPVFQVDGVYDLNPQLVRETISATGTASVSDSSLLVQTGITPGAFATIQSRKRLRYRAGQGVVGRFAGRFVNPVASSILVAGFGHSEDGVYFGYNGTAFGILYSRRGVREIQTLTVTTGSSTNENVVVKLNNVNFNVAVTNSASTVKTAYEISRGTFTGWEAQQIGATVVFVSNSSGAKSGGYSLTGSTAIGAFAQTRAGATNSETWIPQTDWNGDVMDGTGSESNPSGYDLDPTKGNVYAIGIQYLGSGPFTFFVEATTDTGNNAEYICVHTIKIPNTLTQTSFSNPSFPFTMAAYSAGSVTNCGVQIGSFAGFIEGQKKLHGPRTTYFNTVSAASSAQYTPIATVRNSLTYAGKANQSVMNIISASAAMKHNQPGFIFLIKNGTLGGTPNFQAYSTSSCSQWDTAATSVTFTDQTQLIIAQPLAETGDFDHHFANGDEEITLQPGETMTIAVKPISGNATSTLGSMNFREDH